MQEEKPPNCLLNIAKYFYNFYTGTCHGWVLVILLILAIIALKNNFPDYVKLNLTKEILELLLQGLVTLMAIFIAIVIAFGSIKKESKLALWRKYFVHYFRYIFTIIVGDLIILILPVKFLAFFQQPYISEILTLIVLNLNIYAIFLVIKATEQYFNESFEL